MGPLGEDILGKAQGVDLGLLPHISAFLGVRSELKEHADTLRVTQVRGQEKRRGTTLMQRRGASGTNGGEAKEIAGRTREGVRFIRRKMQQVR